jgi:biotin operon repressor
MKNKNEYYYCSVEDTRKYGIIQSAIIGRIRVWCEYNESKKVKDRYYQDYWWSGFISARELSDQLGISESTVQKNLTKLLKTGVLIKGVFNKKGFDRTGWYRINPNSPIGETISPNEIDHSTLKDISITPDRINGSNLTGGTIPINLSINHSVKETVNHSVNNSINPSVEELEAEERGRKILEEFELKKDLQIINK